METWWCEGLKNAIVDPTVAFIYQRHHRSYKLRAFRENLAPEIQLETMDHRPNIYDSFLIKHCPWCGAELPYSLHRNLFDELEHRDIEMLDDVPWPEHLKTDQWWKEAESPLPHLVEPFEDRAGKCFDEEGNFGVGGSCSYFVGTGAMGRSPFTYQAHIREYGIRRFQPGIPVWSQPLDYVPVQYSPWCGRRFAHSLKGYWLGMLKVSDMDPERDNLPDGFVTDYWWRDRPDLFEDALAGTRTPPDNPCTPPPDQVASPN